MITLVSAVFGLLLAALLLVFGTQDHLHVSHGLGWTFAILLCALLGFAPSIFDAMAESLGVSYAPVLGIAIAIAALVIKALLTEYGDQQNAGSAAAVSAKVALLESELQEVTGRPPIDE